MKRILFVDDEPNVLTALRRMLRPMRSEWQMAFARSGEEALELLAQQHFDVLVSDIRMPRMDGAELLTHAHDSYPDTARLILSGHAELEAAMRAVPIAHQFLTKPCEPDALRVTIQRVCGLQEMLTDARLKSIISGLESLPSLPAAHFELTRLLADPDCDLRAVAEVVEQDPGVSAKVLQVVNSAFFGVARRVSKVQEAISLLGTTMIRNLAFTFSALNLFSGTTATLERTMQESLLVGRVAMKLLPKKHESEDAFRAGAMLGLGPLLVASQLREESTAIDHLLDAGVPAREAELQVLGALNEELGAYLLGLWGLPYQVVEAVAYYRRPTKVEQTRFGVLGAVHVAHALILGEQRGNPLDISYLEQLGMVEHLERWQKEALALKAAT